MRTRTALAALALTALAGPLASVAPASASGGDAVRTHGGCQGPAVWKLKVKPDNGAIEFEGEIDSNKAGQVWTWTLRHNGSVSFRGKSMTGGRSGSFSVERRMTNVAGTDHFVFRAVHRGTGDVCRGTISY